MNSTIRLLFLELADLTHTINSLTDHHVFLDVSGHVGTMSIRFYQNGWKPEDPDFRVDTKTIEKNRLYNELESIEQLSIAKDFLEGVLISSNVCPDCFSELATKRENIGNSGSYAQDNQTVGSFCSKCKFST